MIVRLSYVTFCLASAVTAQSSSVSYEELFQQAAELSQQGKYDVAAEKYQTALRLRPGAPQAINNLAVMYYEAGRYLDAFDTASKIWQTHPELKSAALITGMSAVQCNRPKEAIAPLQSLLSVDPDNRDALLALASAHVALQDLSAAAALYEQQTAKAPDDLNAWYGLAICYERTAEQASRKLAQMPGGSAYSKRLLAEFLQNLGDDKLAAEAFGDSNTIQSVPSPEAGKQYAQAREYAQKSRQAFERFVSLAPDSWQAQLFLGDVERQHSNLPAALTHYQNASAQQPRNPAPSLGMGTVYWELGDYDKAETALHAALLLNPDSMQAVFELANIAVRRHHETEAIPLLKQYLAAQPDALAARADLGRAYHHLGKYAEAVEELTKAAPSDETGEIDYQLSTALRKLGRTQEADAALQKSTTLRKAQLQRKQKQRESN